MGLSKELFLEGVEVSDHLCLICLDVIEEPRKMRGCDHHFCKECLETWKEEEDTCPVCRTNGNILSPDIRIVEGIRALPVKCFYRDMGCAVA